MMFTSRKSRVHIKLSPIKHYGHNFVLKWKIIASVDKFQTKIYITNTVYASQVKYCSSFRDEC